MNVYKDISSKSKLNIENENLSIGLFDGVHIGHKKIFSSMKENDSKINVLTFSNDLIKNNDSHFLLTESEKLEMLRKLGVNKVFIFDFKKIKDLSKDDFILFLKNNNLKNIYIGSDFTFGKNRSGNAFDLYNVDNTIINICNLVSIDGIKISSTKIKQYITSGQIELANIFLGYNYFYSSFIVNGFNRGKKLGYSTINQEVVNKKILPKNGVYMTYITLGGKRYLSMTNIGNVPTFNNNKISIETHVINQNIVLKVRYATLEFIKYIREEIKFNSEKELIKQLDNDKKNILKLSKL